MEPLLEEQTKTRPKFNIADCGSQVLEKLKISFKEGTKVDFGSVISDEKQPYEVARLFTSVLQLANFNNVRIESNGVENDLSLTLLDPTPRSITEQTEVFQNTKKAPQPKKKVKSKTPVDSLLLAVEI